jgi:hypothetical protein
MSKVTNAVPLPCRWPGKQPPGIPGNHAPDHSRSRQKVHFLTEQSMPVARPEAHKIPTILLSLQHARILAR